MTKIQKMKVVALASVCMLPMIAVAHAQDATSSSSLGTVTLGVGGVSDTSSAFGRYNGLTNEGAGVFVGWNLQTRDAWDSGGNHYFSFTGDNINFGNGHMAPEALITAKFGHQGEWGLTASYDAMTYTATDHFTSILDSHGNLSPGYLTALTNLGVAGPFIGNVYGAPYVSATPPSYFASFGGAKHYPGGLDIISAGVGSTVGHPLGGAVTYPGVPAALAPYNNATNPSNYDIYLGSLNELSSKVGTRRDKGTVGASYILDDWKFTAEVSYEHKEGTLEQAMTTAGSNAGMVTFPMPINYDTETYTASAAYSTEKLQAILTYEFSNFTDHNAGGYAFEGWNFTAVRTGATSPYTYSSYEQSGIYSLPPSNEAHTITAQVGYNVDQTTRINGTFVYGLQLQNDPFVAPTLNQFTLGNFGSYFSANPTSLKGNVQTLFGNVTVTSRPLTNLDVKASYTIDQRDPHTSAMAIYGDPTDAITPTAINLASSVPGNGCVPLATCSTPWQRLAVPESWTKQTAVLSAGYRILPETRVSVDYTFRDARRANAITHHQTESEFNAKVHSLLMDNVTASVDYTHSVRTASAPDHSMWKQQIMSDCISNVNGIYKDGTNACQQVPFYQAARVQNAVNGRLNAMIGEGTSLSLFGKYTNNQYHSPNAIYSASGTAPFPVLPSVGINHDYSIQAGPDVTYQADKDTEVHAFYTFLRNYRTIRALNNQDASVAPPGFLEYAESSTYDIHTAGIGGTWQASEKLKFGADYIYSYGNQGFAQSGSWTTGEGHQLIGGDPLLNTKSSNHQFKVHATYDYSSDVSLYLSYRFDSEDTTDWALVGASVGQVLTGDLAPKYNVSTIMAAITMKL